MGQDSSITDQTCMNEVFYEIDTLVTPGVHIVQEAAPAGLPLPWTHTTNKQQYATPELVYEIIHRTW